MSALEIRKSNNVVVVAFKHSKVLDEMLIAEIGDEFSELTQEAAAGKKLLLDFAKVEFMSSAMIGRILILQKQCMKDSIDLRLCGICPNIMEIFKLMKLTKVLKIYDNVPGAMKAFGAA